MTRKLDSGWRDEALNDWHVANGFPCPAAGMTLPMIEYDRGKAVGLVNYIRRGDMLPKGEGTGAMYRAFSRVYDHVNSTPLPFLTAVYDPRNWAMRLFPHNAAADALLDNETSDGTNWVTVSELRFAELLYAMRGRVLPDMFGYGVEWSAAPWLILEPAPGRLPYPPFPCADLSARRRAYEPNVTAPMRVKVPCLDVDLAVVDQDDRLALVVDYKRFGALCDVAGTNATALASLTIASGFNVPAFMTRYSQGESGRRRFETYALNGNASNHLAYVLGVADAEPHLMANAVCNRWVRLSEDRWLDVLRVARDV